VEACKEGLAYSSLRERGFTATAGDKLGNKKNKEVEIQRQSWVVLASVLERTVSVRGRGTGKKGTSAEAREKKTNVVVKEKTKRR